MSTSRSSLASASVRVACLMVIAAAAQAHTLSPIFVTATRTPMWIADSLADVTVIDRSQIEQATGHTLAELLQRQGGVQVWSTGGPGALSSVSLRGMDARHTLLLIDGVRYGSATAGAPSWDNIPLELIERIEIVRGPLSGLYGSEAVGGVVQIYTRRGEAGLYANAFVTAGSYHTAAGGGGLRFGNEAMDGSLQISHQDTRGFSATNVNEPFFSFNPDRDGFRQKSGAANFRWRLQGSWQLRAHLLESEGWSQFDDGLGVDSRAKLNTQVASVQLDGELMDNWKTQVQLARTRDSNDTLSSASFFTDLGPYATEQRQATWENRFETPLGTALFAAETLHQSVSKPVMQYAVTERNIQSLITGLSGKAGAHTWQANMRRDRNSQFGSQTTGNLGYGFDLTSQWRVGAAYGTSFVAPSFNQLYFPFFGNPLLQPEEGKHGEVNVRWMGANSQVRLTHFDNRIRSYITAGLVPVNVPRARVDGTSLSYETSWSNWTLNGALEHINPRNDTQGSVNYGKQLVQRAKDSLKFSADYQWGDWRLGGTVVAFSGRFGDAANTPTARLGGFGTLDLRADWNFAKAWSLELRLNNVADKAYETVQGYNQPGRATYVTLRYSGL